ncbi:MAG: hypothetical protein EBR79_03935, partial [Proteobacteria bacterium]|nr:hypothetical protein [Pseudomonadota bacterium]
RPKPTRSRKAPLSRVEQTQAELLATPSRKPAKTQTFSPYPDLSIAISMLERRQQTAPEDRKALVSKWLETLSKTHTEMQKLHQLETLANRFTGKKS